MLAKRGPWLAAADLWTTEQKAEREASRASGVRVDVPHPPAWMRVRPFAPSLHVLSHNSEQRLQQAHFTACLAASAYNLAGFTEPSYLAFGQSVDQMLDTAAAVCHLCEAQSR